MLGKALTKKVTEAIPVKRILNPEEEEQIEHADGFKFLGRPIHVQSTEIIKTNRFLSIQEAKRNGDYSEEEEEPVRSIASPISSRTSSLNRITKPPVVVKDSFG